MSKALDLHSPSVVQFLRDTAARLPNATCLITNERTITYAELLEEVDELTLALQQLGVTQGELVACLAADGIDFLRLLFAVLACEAVAVPLSPQAAIKERAELCRELRLATLVVGREFEESEHGAQLRDFPYRILRGLGPSEPLTHISRPAVIRPTSGTTGRSKGVILSHQSIFDRTAAAQAAFQFSPETDVVCNVLPMAQHFVASLLTYIRYGVPIALAKDALAESMLETMCRYSCSVLYAAPIHYSLLASDVSTAIPPLRLAVSTSAPLSAGVAERFLARYGVPLRQMYGIIELGLPLGNIHADCPPEVIGFPMPGFEAAIDESSGGKGEGELLIRGPGLFDGYLRPPIYSTEVLEDGWFRTGDTACHTSDGAIKILGRAKAVIITAGNKVFPEEVEAVLESYPAIRASRVFSETHRLLGEMIVAEVEIHDQMAADEPSLRRFCRTQLSSYKIPQRIEFVTSIKKTVTGKPKRYNVTYD